MERNYIKQMLYGKPISETPEPEALVLINNLIVEVYIKNGLHRNMTEDKFSEEIKFNTASLYNDLVADPSYKHIRTQELKYIFTEGMKGRLGTDKDIVITYKSLLRWVEGYITHEERIQAVRLYNAERYAAIPKVAAPKPKEIDVKESVKKAYADYLAFINKKSDGDMPRGIVSIGEAFGLPITCRDYGG